MNSAETFCYALVLKGASLEPELLDLLPQDERTAIESAFGEIREVPESEIRLRWRRARLKELSEQHGNVKRWLGKPVEKVAPRLQAWLARPF